MRGGGAPGPGPGHGLGLTIDACVESDGRHSGGEDMADDDCSDSGLLRCARCDFDTPNRMTFIAHLSECNSDGMFWGLKCSLICCASEKDDTHTFSFILSGQVVEGGDTSPDRHNRKLFECDVCNMKFSNGANMRRHKMRHTGVKPYECRVCQKRYSSGLNISFLMLILQNNCLDVFLLCFSVNSCLYSEFSGFFVKTIWQNTLLHTLKHYPIIAQSATEVSKDKLL